MHMTILAYILVVMSMACVHIDGIDSTYLTNIPSLFILVEFSILRPFPLLDVVRDLCSDASWFMLRAPPSSSSRVARLDERDRAHTHDSRINAFNIRIFYKKGFSLSFSRPHSAACIKVYVAVYHRDIGPLFCFITPCDGLP